MQQLFQRLHQENLWDIFYRTEMRLLPLLARMELTGITIDVATVTDIGRILTEEASTLQAEAQALAGKEFNLASSKQVECGVSYMHCSLCFSSINGIFHFFFKKNPIFCPNHRVAQAGGLSAPSFTYRVDLRW
jgi:hypothetical protein